MTESDSQQAVSKQVFGRAELLLSRSSQALRLGGSRALPSLRRPGESDHRPEVTRVVKVGGSLLWDQQLETRLNAWFDAQTSSLTLLVVGGGALADAVRALDRRSGLPAEAAHNLAIRAMQVNSFVLSQLLPNLGWIASLDDWQSQLAATGSGKAPRRAILDPAPFMLGDETRRGGGKLPCSWQVTSDSIAARLAHVVGAVELVLLKSVLPTRHAANISFREAANAGYVDEHFPLAAEKLPRVRAVDLRDQGFAQVTLTRH